MIIYLIIIFEITYNMFSFANKQFLNNHIIK
ncbi:hypothetical protein SAMN05443550_101188 [Pedobacter hartonius]|uniref:Uncharacterized protein n=1 Tax=Pedobacter hartonius TaxID=425514 RepID=A0A1H3WBZ4_9SPHI|nr:hypothetical protein SAMN05443550_101188 [Pedobacter hartonius]